MVKTKEEGNSGTGYEDGHYPFVLYNRAVLRNESNDEITHFRLLIRLKQLAKRSDRQESRNNGSQVLNDFIVGVKSYMEVSSEASDNMKHILRSLFWSAISS